MSEGMPADTECCGQAITGSSLVGDRRLMCDAPMGHEGDHHDGLIYWDRSDTDAYSTMLRAMARRLVDRRKKARFYMRRMLNAQDAIRRIGEATGERYSLGIAPPGTPEYSDRIAATVLALRSRAATSDADAAELKRLRTENASVLDAVAAVTTKWTDMSRCYIGAEENVRLAELLDTLTDVARDLREKRGTT